MTCTAEFRVLLGCRGCGFQCANNDQSAEVYTKWANVLFYVEMEILKARCEMSVFVRLNWRTSKIEHLKTRIYNPSQLASPFLAIQLYRVYYEQALFPFVHHDRGRSKIMREGKMAVRGCLIYWESLPGIPITSSLKERRSNSLPQGALYTTSVLSVSIPW